MFFFQKTPYNHPKSDRGTIRYEKNGVGGVVSIEEFEKISGAAFISQLDFSDWHVFHAITTKIAKLKEKGKLSREQIWLGSYVQKEILSRFVPDVSIRWIDDQMGWGVFAEKNFQREEFIAQYAGLIRKKKRSDKNNAYCFEYMYAPGIPSPYTIDAQDQSGIARFINHSSTPNLEGVAATINSVNHMAFLAKETIAKGVQLTYDYGSRYWADREKPRSI